MSTVIYQIRCKNPIITDIYIGSTTQFNKRKVLHKSRCTNEHGFMYNSQPYVFIRSNGGWDEWLMEILEKYKTCSKEDLRHRERLYYEIYEPTLNSRAPYVEPSQFNARQYMLRREACLIYRKQYYDTNRKEILNKAKEYATSHKEEKSIYNKLYADSHKDELTKKRKQRYDANPEKHRESTRLCRQRLKERNQMSMEDHDVSSTL
jgi:hypothetical protein